VEKVNCSLRSVLHNTNLFKNLRQVQLLTANWKQDYNHNLSYEGLGDKTPKQAFKEFYYFLNSSFEWVKILEVHSSASVEIVFMVLSDLKY
jgi:hypothetical protein